MYDICTERGGQELGIIDREYLLNIFGRGFPDVIHGSPPAVVETGLGRPNRQYIYLSLIFSPHPMLGEEVSKHAPNYPLRSDHGVPVFAERRNIAC